jgi:hypothetical protein
MGAMTVLNNTLAMARDDLQQSKKLRPFPREVERARALPIETDEFGLLDIVIWDAITKNEASHQ